MAAKTAVFESKYHAFNIVRQHKVQVPLPNGTGWQTTQKTIDYQFQPVPSPRAESGFVGVLTLKAGQHKLVDSEDFLREGEEVGVERDAIAALMANRGYGSDFWMQGHSPGTLYPREVDWRRDVIAATANLADEKLAAMIAEERRTHGRAPLISEAEDALAVVAEILAAERAKREADEVEKAPKAKPKAPAAA